MGGDNVVALVVTHGGAVLLKKRIILHVIVLWLILKIFPFQVMKDRLKHSKFRDLLTSGKEVGID